MILLMQIRLVGCTSTQFMAVMMGLSNFLTRLRHYFPLYLVSLNLASVFFFASVYLLRSNNPGSLKVLADVLSSVLYILLAGVSIGALRFCGRYAYYIYRLVMLAKEYELSRNIFFCFKTRNTK